MMPDLTVGLVEWFQVFYLFGAAVFGHLLTNAGTVSSAAYTANDIAI